MSAFVSREPYRFSSGVLTLITHILFFAALYLGVNWHVQQPEGMQVDLWQSLPETSSLPVPSAPPVEAQPAPPQKVEPAKQKQAEKPLPPAKADITLAEKKKKPIVKPKEAAKPEPKKRSLTKAEQKRADEEMQALSKQDEAAEQREQAVRAAKAAQAAAAAAAITSEVEKYMGLIRSKIRPHIVEPPDVADDALADFAITLLPDGTLLDVKLLKSSGNAAYDDAVGRAIRKAEPLPLPQDEAARKAFINPNHVRLKFSPAKRGE